MALPEKVIERLEREPVKTPGWSGRFLLFSTGILALVLVLYGGIGYGYRSYLASQIDATDKNISLFDQRISVADKENIARFYSQIVNTKKILATHVYASGLFGWLEAHTLPAVYFTRLGFTATTNQATLTGAAKTVSDIADQMRVFQSQPDVAKVAIANIGSGQGGLMTFDATITFRSAFTNPFATPSSTTP